MTGLSKQVIRKWEERYHLVQPNRLTNGYRIYTEADINTLLNVKSLSEQGYALKQAVEMTREKVSVTPIKDIKKTTSEQPEAFNHLVFELLEKGTHCDELEIHLILQQAYHSLGLSNFLTYVIVPFLKEVGTRWSKQEWSEYQEAVSSLVVRDFLVQIRRNYQYREDAPLIIGACLPNETHEIPLHIVLLQLMIKGWKTILIGASPAPGSIESMVAKLKPQKVILSATTTLPFEHNPSLMKELDDFAATYRSIDFYLGGHGAITSIDEGTLTAIQLTNSIDDIIH